MVKKLSFILLCTILIAIVLPSTLSAQYLGELVDIEYPLFLPVEEQLSVNITVANTGPGTWLNVCAFVGYRVPEGTNSLPVVNTCPNLGSLEPGEKATFNCSTGEPIPGTAERVWAGIGVPFG